MNKIIINFLSFAIFGILLFFPVQVTLGVNLLSAENSNFSLSVDSVDLQVGYLQAVMINGDGNYFVKNNSSPATVSASIYEGFLGLNALAEGDAVITICQDNIQCIDLSVTVLARIERPEDQVLAMDTSNSFVSSLLNANIVKAPIRHRFTKKLQLGSVGKEVEELQKRLQAERLYVGKIMGRFDYNTRTALKKYQKLKGINQVGILGPLTRASLNK